MNQQITIEDVGQLSLELWLAQRENARLREENEKLRQANVDFLRKALIETPQDVAV